VAAAHTTGLLAIGATNPYTAAANVTGQYTHAHYSEMCLQAMRSGGAHVLHSHCDNTMALRALVAKELALHIARVPASYQLSVATMQPFDCMVFMETCWIPKHGRTVLDTGETCPASSSLRGFLAAFEHLFALHGRGGEWSLTAPYNNPCRSALVSGYGRGLGRYVRKHGSRPVAAHPMSHNKLTVLVDTLDGEQSHMAEEVDPGLPGPGTYARMRYLIKERDSLLFLYLFYSLQRGGEGASIGLTDLSFPGHGPFSPLIPDDDRLLTASFIRIHPPTLKTSLGGPPPPSTHMDVHRAPDERYCFLRRLHKFMELCATLGVPLTPTSPLFRPLGVSDRSTLREESLTTSACYSRLRSALMSAGIYEGESLHSTRRGGAQAANRDGESREEIKFRMNITSDAILDRYLDEGCVTKYNPLTDAEAWVWSPAPASGCTPALGAM
jgi:hypothetical protein